jgi:hypothetical protein
MLFVPARLRLDGIEVKGTVGLMGTVGRFEAPIRTFLD